MEKIKYNAYLKDMKSYNRERQRERERGREVFMVLDG
jgi:hypothetical protein